MNLTDGIFLAFLAVLFAAYYIVPKSLRGYRWVILLIGSLYFYYYSGFILYALATIASTYVFSRLLGRKKSRVLALVWFVLHVGLLAAVKIPRIGLLMPLGISFYTFQSAGYILDVYRGKAEVEKNPLKLALFVSFFPQMIQGPISRFGDLTKTLYYDGELSMENVSVGLRRVLWGFFKKLVIADRLLAAVLLMSGDTEVFYGGYAWLNILIYAVVLYADFTGGIDIAIGAVRLFGVKVTENFDRPFYSKNTAEYWRRWHITMGTWFRDYLFYPLSVCKPMRKFSKVSRKIFGNNFGKRLPVYITTLVTWFMTGLWHGVEANFIAWGLANGIVIVVSQECEALYARFHGRFSKIGAAKWYSAFAVARTFLLMCAIRSFDIYRDVGLTFRMVFSIFGSWNTELVSIGIDAADCIVAALAVALLIIAGLSRPRRWFESLKPPVRLFLCLILLCAILVFGVYGYGYDSNQFIYNQF